MTVFTHVLAAVLGTIVGALAMLLVAVCLKLKQVEDGGGLTSAVTSEHETVHGLRPVITFRLSCGHSSSNFTGEPPVYCPVCGAKVVDE